MTIADAARATRKYSYARMLAKSSFLLPAKMVRSECDRLNLLAVLDAIREPSEMMVDGGDTVAAYGGVSEVWSAMIDAAIDEAKG